MPHLRLLLLLVLASCAGPVPPLVVKPFKMLDTRIDLSGDPMVRGEKTRRLHGAVSVAEQRKNLGAYYTVLWHDPAAAGEVEVVFEYQQGATASRVKRQVKRFPPTDSSGRVEFSVIGEDYARNGRVLAWRISLKRGGREIANEQSCLWRAPSRKF